LFKRKKKKETTATQDDITKAEIELHNFLDYLDQRIREHWEHLKEIRRKINEAIKLRDRILLEQLVRAEEIAKKDLASLMAKRRNLATLLRYFEKARENAVYYRIVQRVAQAIRTLRTHYGIEPEEVDKTIAEISENLEGLVEVEEALTQPLPEIGVSDEKIKQRVDELLQRGRIEEEEELLEKEIEKLGIGTEESGKAGVKKEQEK